jgi:hypothetical protein
MPNWRKRRAPVSVGSNSAILRLPAPKSRHKNDFVFSISSNEASLAKQFRALQAFNQPMSERVDWWLLKNGNPVNKKELAG